MYKTAGLVISILFGLRLHSQTFILSGKVSGNNEPLPFATILVKGTTMGVNTNINGLYTLKLAAGTYDLVYQYVGFARKIERVTISSDMVLDIHLKPEGVALSEVVIKAGEDPAYPIIRQAIKKRKYYLGQVHAYTCNTYIKGLQRINSTPKNLAKLIKVLGGDASDTTEMKGVLYLSESQSKYHYRDPDEKEIMYSSKVSGDNKSFSFNQLSDLNLNLYSNLVDMGNLSSRPFVSPLNENAFLFYKYFLQETFDMDGKNVYKIKIVPKRRSDPCFKGFIYIRDESWRITGADLTLTREAKIDFVDTLDIRQLFAPVMGDSIWMPVSLNLSFVFKIFGFAGQGYFNASIKEYDLSPVFPKRFFKNEILKVENDANKKDTNYWNANRDIPLTMEEIRDYREKDSIAALKATDRYIDSVHKKTNKFELRDILFGYNYHNARKKLSVSLPGIITNGVQYNTVEGLNLSYYFSVNKSYENQKRYGISGRSRYGFANKLWGAELGYYYLFRPEKFSSVGLRVKSIVEQFNRQEPILQLVNTGYTLLMNDNFMKLFKETGMEANYYTELINGLYIRPVLAYMQREPLKNSSAVVLMDDPNKMFTSNDPEQPFTEGTSFTTNSALTAEITFSIRFKQKYYTMPYQKVITKNKYPRLNLTYRKAIPVFNATTDYDFAAASVSHDMKLGLFGAFSFRFKTGIFLNNRNMSFMDYKHFMGNQTFINIADYLGSYKLLPYYSFSADKWYTELHAEHHFKGLIINQIPLLKRLNVQEVIGGHYLANNRLKYYYEVNFGIEKIFKFIRFDYVLAYAPDTKLKQGFTIGLQLSM